MFVSSSIKVSRTSSSLTKRISIQISICVRLRNIEIIEPEMSPISDHGYLGIKTKSQGRWL